MDHNGKVLMDRYELGKLLGQGTFAKVYHARNVETGQSVAIKVIDKDKVVKVGIITQIKREISIMRIVRHPYIINLYEVMATKTKIYFVMEYAKGGELFNKVVRHKLKEDVARRYFQQLINAVDFFHSRGVYHRDLKPENILLDENDNLKVSDFGLSALAESRRQDGLLHTTCGTPAYVAPEVINRRGYDGAKADIWSCGVILYVLLAGYLPFQDSNLMEMYRKIGKAEFTIPSWFPADLRRLISKMLDPRPSTRITIAKIKESSWYRKGLSSKSKANEGILDRQDKEASSSGHSTSDTGEQESSRLSYLNAFDIISLSAGFDLSGLFEDPCSKKEHRFISWKPASTITVKLEELGKRLKLKITKKEAGLFKFEATTEGGRKGILSLDAEVFELTPEYHLVEVKKTSGDTLEYQKMFNEDIRPCLQEIVWAWHGEPETEEEDECEKGPEQNLFQDEPLLHCNEPRPDSNGEQNLLVHELP